MDYLVTGGAGFIGSNIVHRLVKMDSSVRVLDDLSSGRLENLQEVAGAIEFIRGDIRDPATVAAAVRGVRYVLHVAAMPSVVRSVEDPLTTNAVNVEGTLRLLLASRDAGVERFVFSSSSSVYGDSPVLPKRENMIPMPLSPYAVQKLAGEGYCKNFYQLYGLKTFILRYFNVFGPRQNPKSQYAAVIPLFVDAIWAGRPPTIHGDGEQTRDFTFVDDVVDANLCCCTAPAEAAGKVYNIARGDRISINQLAQTINRILGKNIVPVHDAPRPGDVRDSQAESELARRVLGWQPRVGFEEGLAVTVEYFARHHER